MRVSVSGLDGLQASFDGIASRLAAPEPVMRLVRADAMRWVRENTRAGVGPDGLPWAPFDEDTVRQGGGSAATFEDLAASMVAESLGGASFSLGSAADYARFWEFGTEHMPARPFLPPPDAARVQVWVDWIESYVANGELP